MVNQAFMSWLLESSIPSIGYQAYTQLMGLPEDHPDVIQAKHAIMETDPVPTILGRQTEAGHWKIDKSFYTPKYISSHWSMLLLAELSVEPSDPRFQRGAAHMLNATETKSPSWLQKERPGLACFWGDMLHYVAYAGRFDELQAVIQFLIQEVTTRRGRCNHNGGLPCAWGIVRSLWGLGAIPLTQRTPEITQAIEAGIAFLLDTHSLVEANYPAPENGKIHPLWFDLNFPLFYQVDILFTLRVLADLDALNHPGAQTALDWLEQLRREDGHWHGHNPYRQRTYKQLGDAEEIHRWVSLQAARILQQAGRLELHA